MARLFFLNLIVERARSCNGSYGSNRGKRKTLANFHDETKFSWRDESLRGANFSPVLRANYDTIVKKTVDVSRNKTVFLLTTIISEGSRTKHSLGLLALPPVRLPKLQQKTIVTRLKSLLDDRGSFSSATCRWSLGFMKFYRGSLNIFPRDIEWCWKLNNLIFPEDYVILDMVA